MPPSTASSVGAVSTRSDQRASVASVAARILARASAGTAPNRALSWSSSTFAAPSWRPSTFPSRPSLPVQNGRIQLDETTDLPDGTTVQRYIVDEGDELDERERRALDEAIEDSMESFARGEGIPADEVLRLLDADG